MAEASDNSLFFAWWDNAVTSLLAWHADEGGRGWYAATDPRMPLALAASFQRLAEHVAERAADWSDADRERLLMLYQTAFAPPKGTNFRQFQEVRSALYALEKARPDISAPGVAERLRIALIDAGVWGNLPARGQAPQDPAQERALLRAISQASAAGQAVLLERLLDGPGALEAALASSAVSFAHSSHHSTAPLPTDTPWATVVQHAGLAVLRAWLAAGADPSARDGAGRPVLAFASKHDSIAALLEAGADPLAPALPLKQRLDDLAHLLGRWCVPIFQHFRADGSGVSMGTDMASAIEYVATRLRQWPEDEQRLATERAAPALFEIYAMVRRDEHGDGQRWVCQQAWTAVVNLLPLRSEKDAESVLRVERAGARWSFPAALAWDVLTGRRDPGDHLQPIGLTQETERISPALLERDVAALHDFFTSDTSAKRLLRAVPAERIVDCLMLLVTHTEPNVQALATLGGIDPLLTKEIADLHPGLLVQLPELVDAYVDAMWRTPEPQGVLWKTISWTARFGNDLSLDRKARWAIMAWATVLTTGPLLADEEAWATATLDAALTAGWAPSESDLPLGHALAALHRQRPDLDALFKVHALEGALPTAEHRPRVRM